MSFSPLADGLMSYLASRSYDWEAWQIEENEKELRLSLVYSTSLGEWRLLEKRVTLGASPSQVLDEILEAKEKGFGIKTNQLPKALFPKVRNSLGLGAVAEL